MSTDQGTKTGCSVKVFVTPLESLGGPPKAVTGDDAAVAAGCGEIAVAVGVRDGTLDAVDRRAATVAGAADAAGAAAWVAAGTGDGLAAGAGRGGGDDGGLPAPNAQPSTVPGAGS